MILSNYYKSFKKTAEIIPGWEKQSKSDLLNSYIDHENDPKLKDAYIAAIMCRYWGAINKYYQSSYKSATKEDCFEWLTHAVMYALKHRKWKDPKNKLYNDPKAPDKVVNRCIASTRHIFYQAANNDNRKINFSLESIQSLEENDLSYILPPDKDTSDTMTMNLFLKQVVQDRLNKSTALGIQGLILDGIMNADVFLKKDGKILFNSKRLVKHLKHVDDKYCTILSETYDVDKNKIIEINSELQKIRNPKLYQIIDSTLAFLRHGTSREDFTLEETLC